MIAKLCCVWLMSSNPVPVPGFLVLKVCSKDPNDKRSIVYVDPSDVRIIFKDLESPDGCVKIVTSNGRGIFVYGTERGIAEQRNQALREMLQWER